MELRAGELQAILDTIEGTSYSDVQSIDKLLDYGFKLEQWNAFSGSQMSIAKKELHDARRKAYATIIASIRSQEKALGPMLIKDYVNDMCSQDIANYELAERCNRCTVHGIDLVRTAVSALKAEMSAMNFTPQNAG